MYSNEGSKTYQSRVAETNRWQRWGAQSRAEDGEWHHNEIDLWQQESETRTRRWACSDEPATGTFKFEATPMTK